MGNSANPQQKHLDEKRWDLLVNGCIRKFQQEVGFDDTPSCINELILEFCIVILKFYDDQHGDHVEFVNESTIRMNERNYATILFGDELSPSICTTFLIEFEWNSPNKSGEFVFGFITSNIDDSIINWNGYLGMSENSGNSVGIFASKVSKQLFVYDSNHFGTQLGYYESKKKIKNGDKFKMCVAFASRAYCNIYHNDKLCSCLPLDSNIYRPAFSMYFKNDEIKILKWEFEPSKI